MAFSHHYFPFNDLNNKEFYDEIQTQHVLSFEYFNNLIYNNSDFISPNERDNDPDYNLLNDQKPTISNYYNANEWQNICSQYRQKFKLLFCNIASMKTNFDAFITSYFTNYKCLPSIFGLSETHLTDETERLYAIDNYYMLTNNISKGKGGLVLYVNNAIDCRIIETVCFKTEFVETLTVQCSIRNCQTFVSDHISIAVNAMLNPIIGLFLFYLL